MNRLANERIDIKNNLIDVAGIFLFIAGIISLIIIGFYFEEGSELELGSVLFWIAFFILPPLILLIYARNRTIKLKRKDKDILILCKNFLSFTEHTKDQILEKLEYIFSSYPKESVHRFIEKCDNEKYEIYKSCRNLSEEKPQIRYFAIYTLMDIASNDGLFSLTEEEFINEVRERLKISRDTFQMIKNAYYKKGVNSERKILEEQAQRAFEDSFVPFNAYHVLGVSPDITLNQLKIRYRQLAKQYHPDRYVGKKDVNIEEIEDKFNEITLAYKIILKHIQSS
jgi:DnaJ-domain-containing protein 1